MDYSIQRISLFTWIGPVNLWTVCVCGWGGGGGGGGGGGAGGLKITGSAWECGLGTIRQEWNMA